MSNMIAVISQGGAERSVFINVRMIVALNNHFRRRERGGSNTSFPNPKLLPSDFEGEPINRSLRIPPLGFSLKATSQLNLRQFKGGMDTSPRLCQNAKRWRDKNGSIIHFSIQLISQVKTSMALKARPSKMNLFLADQMNQQIKT